MCSIHWIVELLKKLKTKMLSFYKQKTNFSQIVSKRSQNNNIILDISILPIQRKQHLLEMGIGTLLIT